MSLVKSNDGGGEFSNFGSGADGEVDPDVKSVADAIRQAAASALQLVASKVAEAEQRYSTQVELRSGQIDAIAAKVEEHIGDLANLERYDDAWVQKSGDMKKNLVNLSKGLAELGEGMKTLLEEGIPGLAKADAIKVVGPAVYAGQLAVQLAIGLKYAAQGAGSLATAKGNAETAEHMGHLPGFLKKAYEDARSKGIEGFQVQVWAGMQEVNPNLPAADMNRLFQSAGVPIPKASELRELETIDVKPNK